MRYLGSLALKQIIIQHAASPYSKINCSVGTNYSVREKSFIGIKIKICSVGSNLNLKNEKKIFHWNKLFCWNKMEKNVSLKLAGGGKKRKLHQWAGEPPGASRRLCGRSARTRARDLEYWRTLSRADASFLFLYFSKKNYRNIFLVLGFTVLYPYRPAGGR